MISLLIATKGSKEMMINMPVITLASLGMILNKKLNNNRDYQKVLTKAYNKYKDIEGFGECEFAWVYNLDGDKVSTVVLSKSQVLILSADVDRLARFKLVKMVCHLSSDDKLLSKAIHGKLDTLRHEYKESRKLVEIYRPLMNLLLPSIDTEFFAMTHYHMTTLYNRITGENLTPGMLVKKMIKNGLITKKRHLSRIGVKRITNHIELPDKTITTRNFMYTVEEANRIVSRLT
jgi:hypothetical protein